MAAVQAQDECVAEAGEAFDLVGQLFDACDEAEHFVVDVDRWRAALC